MEAGADRSTRMCVARVVKVEMSEEVLGQLDRAVACDSHVESSISPDGSTILTPLS